jgi:secreted trypsin-like serine protease
VQFKLKHEVRDSDYETSLMKTIFKIPVVIGLVSFGSDCGWNIPSVNTRVPYYRDWIQSVMNIELKTNKN